jgi:hypothetical protein
MLAAADFADALAPHIGNATLERPLDRMHGQSDDYAGCCRAANRPVGRSHQLPS